MKLRSDIVDIAADNEIDENTLHVVLGCVYLYESIDYLCVDFQPAELMTITRLFCYFDHENNSTKIKPEYQMLFEDDLWSDLIKILGSKYNFTPQGPPNLSVPNMYSKTPNAGIVLNRLAIKKVPVQEIALVIAEAYTTGGSTSRLHFVITDQLETLLLFSRPAKEFNGLV